MAHPGSPPRRTPERPDDQQGRTRERSRRAVRPERPRWQADAFGPDDTDADLPPWAGPTRSASAGAGTRHRGAGADPYSVGYAGETTTRVHDEQHVVSSPDAAPDAPRSRMAARRQGRAAAARLRKSRRRVYRWSVAGVVVCVVGAVIAVIATQSSPKPTPYVTSLLPGEFKSVPSACGVSPAVLTQYLPGSRTTTNQFSGATQSQCSFTVDDKPVFRLLEVSAQAFQPFAAASGNGSASQNASDNLALAKSTLTQPPRKSPLSPAQITPLSNLGQQAFAAYQRETASGIVSDLVTVVVLDRNVLITVELSAQESPGFSPTPATTLQAGATAAAQDMLTRLKAQPVA